MSAIQKLVWLLVVGLVQALREKADSVIQSGSGVINSLASTHAKEVHTDEWGFKARALKKEAEKGDAQAAYDLGEMYEDGEGAKKDNREANHWYLMALRNGKKDAEVAYYRTLKIISKERASKGDWTAMYDLGDIYEHGKGGLTDLKEAAKYYQMAAEHGHERANYALGRFYEEGKGGLEKSFDKAEKYYKVAADKGMADAMNALSLLYGEGRNGVPNAYQAIEYAKKAANKGHPEAKERFYEDKTFQKRMYERAAAKGDVESMFKLADVYRYGRNGLPRDTDKAYEWYHKAAREGDTRAMWSLGDMYRSDGSTSEACYWFLKGANPTGHGLSDAKALGCM